MSRHTPRCPLVIAARDMSRLLEIVLDDDPDLWRKARRVLRRVDKMHALLRQHLEADDPLMLDLRAISRAADQLAERASGI